MGTVYYHKCNFCGYTVHTSGPWEFYRDDRGEVKPYGHPEPISEEAEISGIHGLTGVIYCHHCDETFKIILVEFKKPTYDKIKLWLGQCEPLDEYKNEEKIKCPKCGSINVFFGFEKNEKITCPRCREGKFISKIKFIT